MARRRARGEGSIRKRKDGRWEGRYTIGRNEETGKLIYKNVLARTQAECKRKLGEAIDRQQESVENGSCHKNTSTVSRTGSRPSIDATLKETQETYTVGQWLSTWYALYSKPNLRKSTQVIYSYYIKDSLLPRIGELPIQHLSGLRLQKLYQELRENGKVCPRGGAGPGLSPKTIRGIHMLLHSALEQAVREGILTKNPTIDCKPPKLEKREMRVIQPEQVSAYLRAAADRNVLPMFYLELTSGLRKGELLALLWSDLDIEKCSISVTKAVSRREGELEVTPPKTRHSIRNIVIPRQAVDLLLQEHSLHPDNPYMFPSPVTGTMYNPDAVGRIHKKILKDAGLEDCRFHDLRHTFATLAIQNGVDIKTLSGILGHYSSGFTLDTYTHVTQGMKQDAADKMGRFMEMKL